LTITITPYLRPTRVLQQEKHLVFGKVAFCIFAEQHNVE